MPPKEKLVLIDRTKKDYKILAALIEDGLTKNQAIRALLRKSRRYRDC